MKNTNISSKIKESKRNQKERDTVTHGLSKGLPRPFNGDSTAIRAKKDGHQTAIKVR